MSQLAKLSNYTSPGRPFGVVSGSRVSAAAARPAAFNQTSPLRFHGLHLVTAATRNGRKQQNPVDTLAQARRIVAQVEWEIQQQAIREAALLQTRWRAPIAIKPAVPQAGLLHRLRHAVGF